MSRPDIRFPDGFVWGAATASYQIEGSADSDGRGLSVWDVFCRREGAVRNGDSGAVACDHVRLLDVDLDVMSELALQSYRFSTSWSRIIPEGVGTVSEAGLDFYDRLVDGLLGRGIDPTLTLFHWDLPQALEDRGGWRARDCADWFTEYALVVHERLGDRVARWATFNEPWCYAFLGHASGEHAPGRRNPAEAVAVAHHQLLGHGRAVSALRSAGATELGIVLNPAPVRADPTDPVSDDTVRRVDSTLNRLFLDPVLAGRYPADLLADLDAAGGWRSCILPGDEAEIAAPIDWLGVNYYNDHVLRPDPDPSGASPHPTAPPVRPADTNGVCTDLGWPITPQGLTEMLVDFDRRYENLPPIYITENGAAYDDPVIDDVCDDPRRQEYIEAHLRAVHDAIDSGVDVRGYFAWSLLDNFEWAHGYAMRFGIVHVDYETQHRTIRTSGRWYSDICRTGVVPGTDG